MNSHILQQLDLYGSIGAIRIHFAEPLTSTSAGPDWRTARNIVTTHDCGLIICKEELSFCHIASSIYDIPYFTATNRALYGLAFNINYTSSD